MKEEWKVYIKGVPNRGNEVIKVLTDLGAENTSKYDFNDLSAPTELFFIGHDGKIHFAWSDNEIGKIIMDNYHEIKLPEQWKDGDIIFSPKFGSFAVYGYDGSDNPTATYCYVTKTDIISYPTRVMRCDYRLATPEEIKQFYELLHKHGKDWDAENKQLVDYNARWKPSDRTEYYYVTASGDADNDVWHDWNIHEKRHAIGNCFRTEEAAKRAADAFRELLKNNIFDNDDDDDDADE